MGTVVQAMFACALCLGHFQVCAIPLEHELVRVSTQAKEQQCRRSEDIMNL
jgi:hypothetical protein